ncbi:hypothetical protein Glove_259g2 [Diversispora epigaea]|uniref:Uncharacterized protein n=1 Tax=Diversispora epigaea TaxID=1348612 RepID=A0A397IC53_9GLOM|nr:hypothetical protein Glove_259g2 [Diversispora epigaea]
MKKMKEMKKLLKKERKLKAKEFKLEKKEKAKKVENFGFTEQDGEKLLIDKEENDDGVGFNYPKIFFLINIIDGELLLGDVVFGEPKDKGMYVEFKGESWNEIFSDDKTTPTTRKTTTRTTTITRITGKTRKTASKRKTATTKTRKLPTTETETAT